MKTFRLTTRPLCAITLFALAVTPTYAAAIVSGGSLLNVANANQLANWVGVSGVIFTDIYTFKPGDTTIAWHSAVDNKGPTFTLITARVSGSSGAFQLIGGYNPQSWASAGGLVVTRTASDRTAFIFDLTTNVIQRQVTDSAAGQYQTYRDISYGPVFGWGYDIGITGSNLQSGAITQYSYSLGNQTGVNLFGAIGSTNIEIGSIETYTFTTVPELPNLVSTAFGIWLLVWMRRKKIFLRLTPQKA